MLDKSLATWRREEIHGTVISQASLSRWMQLMASIPSRDRQQIYGVRPVRADVFPAGICILEEALRFFRLDAFTVSATGLRLGVALSIL
jgi:exopolyphosphatase/pppGpp-phosphohydrolase